MNLKSVFNRSFRVAFVANAHAIARVAKEDEAIALCGAAPAKEAQASAAMMPASEESE